MTLLKKIFYTFLNLRDRQRLLIGLTKGNIAKNNRSIDPSSPFTWEFSGLSQNGEDGIIDFLLSNLKEKNNYFIEIGAADGIDNNSSWLLVTKKYNGLMIEANKKLSATARRIVSHYSHGLNILNKFVTVENVSDIKKLSQYNNPDLFSLDIDSMDYYIAEEIFNIGFRPKIFVVEYNSVFGPTNSMTIKYSDNFEFGKDHPSFLYYGVSIQGWKNLFHKNGYKFISVESNGVNAFFVDPDYFEEDFFNKIKPNHFAENQLQLEKFRIDHTEQFSLIKHLEFYEIQKG